MPCFTDTYCSDTMECGAKCKRQRARFGEQGRLVPSRGLLINLQQPHAHPANSIAPVSNALVCLQPSSVWHYSMKAIKRKYFLSITTGRKFSKIKPQKHVPLKKLKRAWRVPGLLLIASLKIVSNQHIKSNVPSDM